MKESHALNVRNFFKVRIFIFLNENGKIIVRFLFTALFIILAAWFILHQKHELTAVRNILSNASGLMVLAGFGLVIFYIYCQGMMYVTSFGAIDIHLNVWDAIILFLKRNFVSVFLPAGGVSSLAFFTREIEKKGITRTQIYYASSIRAFIGILSVVIVAIPAFLLIVSNGTVDTGKWLVLGGVISILLFFILVYYSIVRKTRFYFWLLKLIPRAEVFLADMHTNQINRKQFIFTVLISVIIEFIGIAHVYVSISALHFQPSLSTAVLAYIIVVLFLIISPFLRGLGAIEVSMTYVLIKTGFTTVDAIAITFLFRFFEFWLPLLAGIVSFLLKLDKLIMRILPALLIFVLGIINIISVLTPAIPERLAILKDYLLVEFVSFSNSFVLISGLLLLVTAAFLLRGLRTAWWFAIGLSIISVFGHITKGIDYEEASVALLIVGCLIATRKEYHIRTNPKLGNVGWRISLLSTIAVIMYGVAGFYFVNKRHFLVDFTFMQSLGYSVKNFFLIGSKDLIPQDRFARDFIYLIKVSGFASISFLVYSFVRPYVFRETTDENDLERATDLTKKYGRSALDYFKTYSDKNIYSPPEINAYISYRVSRNFAVVLEDPVAGNETEMKQCIVSFDKFSFENGLKSIYYRVPKESLSIYTDLGKKSLFIGQEAVIDLNSFSLEGGEKKSIRNALNKIREQGFTSHVNAPPLKDGFVQKLKSVSDEWMKITGREEIIFSQGMFVEKEIKQETVITVENNEEKIIAFLNIIPSYARQQGTYDLLRKTADAPNGIMDYILIELFNYFRAGGIRYIDIGFAPLSGLNDPHNFTEKSMRFAYEKIRSFSHYKGQREYKDKFNPVWQDKFLIYGNDYDLIQVPGVLGHVIKA